MVTVVNGLDLETNHYLVQGTKFEVDKRYAIVQPISYGPYGIVCSAEDKETGETVALKKVEGVFEHTTTTKRTLRELRILRHLVHENVMQVSNIFITGGRSHFEELYVINDLMETDLASTLKSTQALTEDHCQFFLYQIMRGMKYVHSAQVIHRDLKPRSLFVNSNCDLKIGDFALARIRFSVKEWVCPMTEYVCTRWYRAPEVLCSWTDYSLAIDIWSIGCILAEMLMRKALFPGVNTQNQLDLIIGLLGSPDGDELMKIPNEKCRKFINSLPKIEARPFADVFVDSTDASRELLALMLRWDPDQRMSVDDAIQHPYLEKLHCAEDEPTRGPLNVADFEFERRKIIASGLREEIFRETLYYYPELLAKFDEETRVNGTGFDINKYRLLVPGESQYSSDEEGDSD